MGGIIEPEEEDKNRIARDSIALTIDHNEECASQSELAHKQSKFPLRIGCGV